MLTYRPQLIVKLKMFWFWIRQTPPQTTSTAQTTLPKTLPVKSLFIQNILGEGNLRFCPDSELQNIKFWLGKFWIGLRANPGKYWIGLRANPRSAGGQICCGGDRNNRTRSHAIKFLNNCRSKTWRNNGLICLIFYWHPLNSELLGSLRPFQPLDH